MLSTASAPSTSLAAAFRSYRARRRRRALWLRPVASAASASGVGDDGGAERFATSSSITDYLRYRRPELGGAGGGAGGGGGGGVPGGELQTAVVRFKKRFPWTLIHPFLNVSLLALLCVCRSPVPMDTGIRCASVKMHKMLLSK